MLKPVLVPSLILAAMALPLVTGEAAVIYRSNEGWSVEGDPTNAADQSAADLMRRGEQLEGEGNTGGAIDAYRGVVKRYPSSAFAAKAQRKVGLLLDRSGDVNKAFDAYNVYLTKYPRGEDFDVVVESMFRIGKLFLDTEKRRILGIPVGSSLERAQQMFEEIVKRAPYSKWAPLAQFNIGQAYEKQGKFAEAISAYQVALTRYPSDAIADDALYQMGYVRLTEYRTGSYDRQGAQRAREAFEEFINRFPESEKVPQARENLKQLEGGQNRSVLDVAKFYDRTKQYKAAVIYYNDVIKSQPAGPDVEYAKTRIAVLKETVGEDALRAGPERTETGERAEARRRLQARVDVVSRPDYVGPPVAMAPVESAPGRPRLRTSPGNVGPAVEPALPSQPEALTPETGLPVPQ